MVIVLLTFAGCGTNSPGNIRGTSVGSQGDVPNYLSPSGFPIVKTPINLTMMVAKPPTHNEYDKMLLFQEYEKKTGIHISWIEVPQNTIAEKRNLALASGDVPDAFFKANMPYNDLLKYGSQGAFVKLNDLIDKYGKELKGLLTQYPDVKKGISMPDGAIYSVPFVADLEGGSGGNIFFINKKWKVYIRR
jgi:putative aldouronate transport system substrate-binding protein